MTKEVVAVDVDEVLFPYVESFVGYHNEIHGTNLAPEDFFTYEFEHVLGLTVGETIRRVHDVHDLGFDTQDPIEGAWTALDELSKRFNLFVITARNPGFEVTTRDWLHKNFPGIFQDVILTGHPQDIEKPRSKFEICTEIGAVALIDDSFRHVAECAGTKVVGILFGDYAWNRTEPVLDGVVRCKTWLEVVEYFNGRSI